MTDLFLKMKHWQVFILTFAIPMIITFIMMGSMMSFMINEMVANNYDPANPDPLQSLALTFDMLDHVKYYYLIILAFSMIFYVWIWSVATGLQKRLPENATMNFKLFKIAFFSLLISSLLIVGAMIYAFSFAKEIFVNGINDSNNATTSGGSTVPFFGLISIVYILVLAAMFYIFYFTAKTIKMAEYQHDVKLSDYIAEIFMVWLLPIGIWFIQPKVNKIVSEEMNVEEENK
ncbi:MAG TPA: hypothetical protein PLN63_09085 [Paludibacteraceae bacterium]|nr:hypothetical protein [Paludibacteraceae bacterium]HPH63752.1 hypothetical protein [Paludibacteraceae bacterium]HQF51095.1 hypothetical protein [Paludibacteraceae bacterium]